jgi:hypothetical protein
MNFEFKTWEQLKLEGSQHYKTGATEPIDLYKSKGVFKPFALCCIAKYAMRNADQELNIKDMVKIIHYTELLIAERMEKEFELVERTI